MRVESSTSTSTRSVAGGRPSPSGRWWAAGLLLLAGCRGEMYDQPREATFDASAFFEDGKSARPLVAGTIARGELRADRHRYVGKTKDLKPVDTFPFPIDRPVLARGQRLGRAHRARSWKGRRTSGGKSSSFAFWLSCRART